MVYMGVPEPLTLKKRDIWYASNGTSEAHEYQEFIVVSSQRQWHAVLSQSSLSDRTGWPWNEEARCGINNLQFIIKSAH
jgi:hypothetical protein